MNRQLFPRRFMFGCVCISITALWMTGYYVLVRLLGLIPELPLTIPVIIINGWVGVGLLISGLVVGIRKSRRYSLLVDMNLQINRAILIDEDLDRIYDTVLEYVFKIFPNVTFGSVLTLGDDGYLTFAASKGYQGDYVRSFRLKLEESFLFQESKGHITGAKLISHKTLQRLYIRFHPDNWDFQSVISAPLFVNGQLFGLLNLDSSDMKTFVPSDIPLVERLTSQIEVCLFARGMYLERINESRVDALTGLFTRRYFEDLLHREIGRASRYAESFILALIDADGLKQVNDTLGHRAGDRFLVSIAETLRGGNRTSDILGRFGGDEFVVVYLGSNCEAIKLKLTEDLDRLRSNPVDFEGTPITASFSFGLALYPDEGKSLDELTDTADQRLYEMKKTRRKKK